MISFPNKDVIQKWAAWITSLDYEFALKKYLPPLDGLWASKVVNDFELTAMSQYSLVLSQSAARLFYGIIKNHRLLDGNKRSALVCVYLFVAMNGYWLDIPPKVLYKTARSVARGKQEQGKVISELSDLFEKYFVIQDSE